jgi:molecular chaperone GrpE
MEKEGVVRYDPLGDKFDPNLHNALFEVPDATKEPGTVAVVIKVRPPLPRSGR